jgi:hypothetical protein
MPVMPRQNKKATKIAFRILGKPANLQSKPEKKEKSVKARLIFEETMRVR